MGLPAMQVRELAIEHGYEGELTTLAHLSAAEAWLWERAIIEDSFLESQRYDD
jgi:hypothetical protein